MGNKVKYGLKNAHYATYTVVDSVVTFVEPKKIPGAVTLSITAKGEKADFYADDINYFTSAANQGYEGDAEFALLSDEFRKDILNDVEDASGVLFENSNANPNPFALLFEFTGDVNGIRHVLYNVTVARPSIESGTKNNTIEVKTDKLTITASPAIDTGYVKAKVDASKAAIYESWFTTVYKFVPEV